MLTLILNQIKAYWQLAVGLIIIVVILWGGYELHHSGYQEAMQYHADYVADQERLAKEAEQFKIAKEKEDAKHTQQIMDAYNTSALTLAERLRDIQDMPRGAGVPVASPSQSASSVSATSNPSGRVDATFALKPSSAFSVDAGDALRDTLQCEKLQEWVTSISK